MPSARSVLRSKLSRGETIVAPGAYDPLGARVIRSLGFPAVYTGGYASGAHLAITEPLMTMTEQIEVGRKVASSVELPVIVDGNAGFGDALHTMRAVRAYEEAGLAAMHIEDQVYPKRASYHMGLEHTIPLEEFLEKMRYALQARRDDDFVIIGRTDAFSDATAGSMEEAVRLNVAAVGISVFIGSEYERQSLLNLGKLVDEGEKYGIPVMRKTGGGVIINTGSVHSLVSFATATAYDSAKAGVLGLTRTLAIDYGPDIRVCAVLPGAILTPLWDDLKVPQKERRRYAKMVPANRLGTGEDIANAVLFLVSDEASFITGTSLTVDGGMLARTE